MIRKTAILAAIIIMIFAVVSCSSDKSAGPKDKIPPTVSLVTPWDGTTRSGIVDVKVDADDDVDIARVEVFVNNSLVGTDTSYPFEIEWDMDSLANGSSNSVYSRAVDVNGNAAKSTAVTVTKGVTSVPTATITNPSNGSTFKQGEKITFSGTGKDNETALDISDTNISWKSSLMGVIGQGQSLDYRGLVIGSHTITITVADANGQTAEASVDVTIVENDFMTTAFKYNFSYAIVDAGTYQISEPVFKRGFVELTKPFMIQKTEMSIKQALAHLDYFFGIELKKNTHPVVADFIDDRNGNTDDVFGIEIFASTTTLDDEDPNFDDMVYGDYPMSFIMYIEACAICNAMSAQDGATILPYKLLDKDGNDIGGRLTYPPKSNKADIQFTKVKTIEYNPDNDGWRLPTEAEWEVAARAGIVGMKFPWGNTGPAGLCNSMSDPLLPNPIPILNGRGPVKTTEYQPNGYGLYNMSGNVAELCSDMYVGKPPSGPDPIGVSLSVRRSYLAKGGAWYEFGVSMQIGLRYLTLNDNTSAKDRFDSGIGLRVVRTIND